MSDDLHDRVAFLERAVERAHNRLTEVNAHTPDTYFDRRLLDGLVRYQPTSPRACPRCGADITDQLDRTYEHGFEQGYAKRAVENG